MISITNFEELIDLKIVKRGREYYEANCVEDLEQIKENNYTATVIGSEYYEVQIVLENDYIQKHFCDCPYDYGEFCKHEVAVLFSIVEQYETIKMEVVENTLQKTKPTKDNILNILDAISHQELKEFIHTYTATNKNFKDTFIRNFAVVSGSDSFQLYQKQIKDIYKSGKDRYGFIEWNQMKKVGNRLLAFLSEIDKYIDQGNLVSAFNRSSALLEESVDAVQFCDDSDGYLSELISGCFSILDTIALAELQENFRKNIMAYCLDVFDKQRFKGWDWHEKILVVAGKFIKNKKEAEQILTRILENSDEDRYGFETLQNLKYDILLKWSAKSEAEKFLNENLQNAELRAKAISIAVNNFDYEKAKEIARKGISCDKKQKPGLVSKWYNHLLKIAELEDDKFSIILYAQYLFKDNFYPERDYYEILKKHVAEQDWEKFVDEMISDILKQDKYYGKYELVASVYIREKRWMNLFELIKQSQSIHFLEVYEEYVKTLFPTEVINLYIEYINIVIDEASSRNNYKSICQYLKKIKKMGAEERVKEMVLYFKAKYPKKRALIDELDKV